MIFVFRLLSSIISRIKFLIYLRSFHKTNLMDTLVKMTGFNTQQKYGIHLLEIVTLILREQVINACLLFKKVPLLII